MKTDSLESGLVNTPSRRRPAYLVIADSLRSQIAEQKLKPGERFPTERELVQEFGVARMTVRQALDILQIEGLIDRKRGRAGGTFVRAIPPTLDLTCPEGVIGQLDKRGEDIEIKLVSCVKAEVLKNIGAKLGVEDGTAVWEVKRLVCDGDDPLLVSSLVIPVDLAPDLDQQKLNQPLADVMASYGLRPVFKRETVCAANARKEEQRLLGVSRSYPMLRLQRIAKLSTGQVMCYMEETLRSDAANVEVTLGDDPAPQLD